MSQNVYDSPRFFEEYSKLPRSIHGLDSAPEWPMLLEMVGDVRGLRILDLGCGFGWFCRWAAEAGAASVQGIDVSKNMLSRAQAETSDSRVTYQCQDLENVALPEASYDIAYSSLTLHYLPELLPLFDKVQKSLKPGGLFVFSIEHPITTASPLAFKSGWRKDEDGQGYWPLNRYHDEGLRVTNWLAPDIKKYHRTVETYLMSLLQARFFLTEFREFWEGRDRNVTPGKDWGHMPDFLLVAAQKGSSR